MLCVSVCSQEKLPLPDDSVYVLLPLDAQKGKHFAEKFAREKDTTFWYQDEKRIVCQTLPPPPPPPHTHTT